MRGSVSFGGAGVDRKKEESNFVVLRRMLGERKANWEREFWDLDGGLLW